MNEDSGSIWKRQILDTWPPGPGKWMSSTEFAFARGSREREKCKGGGWCVGFLSTLAGALVENKTLGVVLDVLLYYLLRALGTTSSIHDVSMSQRGGAALFCARETHSRRQDAPVNLAAAMG